MKTRTRNIRRRNARLLQLESLSSRELMAADLMGQAELAAMAEANPEQFAEYQTQQEQLCAVVESDQRQSFEEFNEQELQNLEEAMNLMLAGNDNPGPLANNVGNNAVKNAAPQNAAPQNAAPANDNGEVTLVPPQEKRLTKAEKHLLKDDKGLLKKVNNTQKAAAEANRKVAKAEKKVAEIERKLGQANNQKKLDDYNAKIKQLKERITELKNQLQKVQEDEKRAIEADRTHRVPVGQDEYGNTIYGSADNGHRSRLFAEKQRLKRRIEKLEKDVERLERKKQPVEKRVQDLQNQKERAQQAVNDAKKQANAANRKVDDARRAARAKAEADAKAKAAAKAARRAQKIREKAERDRKAMQDQLKEFDRRQFYIMRAIEALQKLGLVDENLNPARAVEQARADWTRAMESNWAGTMALVAGDATTLAPGGGTALSVTQALYGILGIRQSSISPSNQKAYIDQTTGLVGKWNKLPVLSGDIHSWLEKHRFAHNKPQAEEVRIEMERIMNVKTVDVGLR